ncbi:MAG: hypothetical protein KJZ98_04505 [Burkholderiaceae bacterium]|nr:hypothetical protein [Burkholderiaceae bacterium]MEB2350812.1 hypothetical protein [Burkholderiaceae bacterium]
MVPRLVEDIRIPNKSPMFDARAGSRRSVALALAGHFVASLRGETRVASPVAS